MQNALLHFLQFVCRNINLSSKEHQKYNWRKFLLHNSKSKAMPKLTMILLYHHSKLQAQQDVLAVTGPTSFCLNPARRLPRVIPREIQVQMLHWTGTIQDGWRRVWWEPLSLTLWQECQSDHLYSGWSHRSYLRCENAHTFAPLCIGVGIGMTLVYARDEPGLVSAVFLDVTGIWGFRISLSLLYKNRLKDGCMNAQLSPFGAR